MTDKTTIVAALLAGAAIMPGAAFAQATANTAEAQSAADGAAEGDIIVTARFRDESVQDVPIAITAISGSSLAERNLTNLQTIATAVPTVDFRTGASNKDRSIFIRGVGTITTSPGVEPSVSTVLDGVVLARPGQSTLDLGEVERIEVLRGPQGTLFGKNASAGVVNIVTRNPTDETQVFGEIGATSDEEYRVKGGVSGAIVPGKVQALIGGLWTKWDGNVRNVALGNKKVNGFRRYGARGKLLFTPTDDLKITAIADYLNSKDTVPTHLYQSASQTAYPTNVTTTNAALLGALTAAGITPSPSNRRALLNLDTFVKDKNYGGSVTADLTLGDYNLTSITAYRGWENVQVQDGDGLAAVATGLTQTADRGTVDSKQFSQEFRLTSPKNDGQLIDYVLGAYYLYGKTDEVYQRTATTLPGPLVTTGRANYGIRSNNYALFGEANINFTDRFRAIAGYRSVWDDVEYYHIRTSTNDPTNQGAINPALDRPGIRSYHNTAGKTDRRGDAYRLGLQLDVNPNNQLYATFSRGYKGPGYNVYFNMRSLNVSNTLAGPIQLLDEVPLSPETSKSYELGFKGNTSDRSFSYALALYSTSFEGFQANFTDNVQGVVVTRLINAGSVKSQGAEADVTLRPTRGLTIDLSATYTDAKVKDFLCPVGAPVSCDIDGKVLPFAPKFKFYGNAAYEFAVSSALNLEIQTDYSYRSKTQYALSQTPNTIEPAYGIWNASVALKSSEDGWQVRAYVKNIADVSYSPFLAAGGSGGTARWAPRDDKRYAGILLRKDM